MIRINLIVPRRPAAVRANHWLARALTLGGPGLAAAAGLIVAAWAWSLHRDAAAVAQAQAAADAALARLAPTAAALAAAETRRADLADRVALIERLQAARGEPGRILDQVSRQLPDGVWLTGLRQDDAGVIVRGGATTVVAVSDYVANLEASGRVELPVEITRSQREPQPDGIDIVRFEVRLSFRPPGDAG